MPTGGSYGQFKMMYNATYWAWDGTDKGYYVFQPGVGTSGTAGSNGTLGTGDDKSKALLFFPATGQGSCDDYSGSYIYYAGCYGDYWASTLASESMDCADHMGFFESSLSPEYYSNRYKGFSVRPVSD